MRPGGVGISGKQRVNRLFRQQTTGAAEVIEDVGIVGMLGQRRLQIRDGLRQLSRLDLRNSYGSFSFARSRCGIAWAG